VVVPTYKALADTSKLLYEALTALKDAKTQVNAQKAALMWKRSRAWWEMSEAFLFGPATVFGIDPHIDTWPIALDELESTLSDQSKISAMSAANGDIYAGNHNSDGLLGFHAIEYILFRDGNVRQVDAITNDELIMAVAVAGDLRNHCYLLEAGWAGINNIDASKKSKLLTLDLDVIGFDTLHSYGKYMKTAGAGNQKYSSYLDAVQTIIDGCIDIADEVGEMKIGQPHTGEDINNIESPYSYNSRRDFIDNIISIQNSYFGGINAADRASSLHTWVSSRDISIDEEVTSAINRAITAIDAIPQPFALNLTSNKCAQAMEACEAVSEAFNKVRNLLEE
jgi:uncharacterized iron-regulated protein